LNLDQFRRWYSQSGTPEVDVSSTFDADKNCLSVKIKQSYLSPTQSNQKPYFFPFAVGILKADGSEYALKLQDCSEQPLIERGILLISKEEEEFVFEGISAAPILSLNRNFSAPVKVHTRYQSEEYAFLMAHDSDEFNRFEASQNIASLMLHKLIDMLGVNAPMRMSEPYLKAFKTVLLDEAMDVSLKADSLSLPSVSMLMQERKVLDVEAIYMARNFVKREIVRDMGAEIRGLYERLHNEGSEYTLKSEDMAKRKLKNVLLSYLSALRDDSIALKQYENAHNMTDRLGALSVLANSRGDAKNKALADFYSRYESNTLVMNKYLSVIASSELKETLQNVQDLLNDKVFDMKVPNLVRALIGSFARNALHFHAVDGSGYAFISQKVIELDDINPQIASGLAGVFKDYPKLNEKAKELMQSQLKKVLAKEGLSDNVYEIVSKILA
jgi:aminopeptidase N